MEHTAEFLVAAVESIGRLDQTLLTSLAQELHALRDRGGRLFILGVGGSAANASHAVNDFRKLCNIEAYAATDNVAELTAWVNDEGWEYFFQNWLTRSRLGRRDALLILSVGGGDLARNVSAGLVFAAGLASGRNARVWSIVGRPEADLLVRSHSDIGIVIPAEAKWRTPICEALQMVILHCLVSHPLLQVEKTKW